MSNAELGLTTQAVAAEAVPVPNSKASYEKPELVELGLATRLLQGIVYTKYYQDCGDNGTTDSRPRC